MRDIYELFTIFESMPVIDENIVLGTKQGISLLDLRTGERMRKVVVILQGRKVYFQDVKSTQWLDSGFRNSVSLEVQLLGLLSAAQDPYR